MKLRRRFGSRRERKSTRMKDTGQIVSMPITDEYIQKMAGITGTKGKLLKALMQEKAKEHEL